MNREIKFRGKLKEKGMKPVFFEGSLCGCEFEYDNNDTEMDKAFCFTTFPPTYKTYVKCPECGAKIFLSTMIDN